MDTTLPYECTVSFSTQPDPPLEFKALKIGFTKWGKIASDAIPK